MCEGARGTPPRAGQNTKKGGKGGVRAHRYCSRVSAPSDEGRVPPNELLSSPLREKKGRGGGGGGGESARQSGKESAAARRRRRAQPRQPRQCAVGARHGAGQQVGLERAVGGDTRGKRVRRGRGRERKEKRGKMIKKGVGGATAAAAAAQRLQRGEGGQGGGQGARQGVDLQLAAVPRSAPPPRARGTKKKKKKGSRPHISVSPVRLARPAGTVPLNALFRRWLRGTAGGGTSGVRGVRGGRPRGAAHSCVSAVRLARVSGRGPVRLL